MQTLWMFIPEEAYILVIVGVGLAIMLRFFTPASGLSIVGVLCLIILVTPFIETLAEIIPNWALMLILVFFSLSFIRMIFGRRVSENVISMILFNILCMPFKMFRHIFFRRGR